MSDIENKLNATLFAFDSDADGMLSPSEVLLAQLSLGVLLNNEQKKKFESQLGDSDVKYEKAYQLIRKVTKDRDAKSEIKQLLKPFDTENDGTISLSELSAVFTTLSTRVNDETLSSLASKFTDGDRLKYDDFLDYLLS